MGKQVAVAVKLAEGEGLAFWQVGGEVYRAPANATMDRGAPMGARWECSVAQWLRFRESVFAWAADVAA